MRGARGSTCRTRPKSGSIPASAAGRSGCGVAASRQWGRGRRNSIPRWRELPWFQIVGAPGFIFGFRRQSPILLLAPHSEKKSSMDVLRSRFRAISRLASFPAQRHGGDVRSDILTSAARAGTHVQITHSAPVQKALSSAIFYRPDGSGDHQPARTPNLHSDTNTPRSSRAPEDAPSFPQLRFSPTCHSRPLPAVPRACEVRPAVTPPHPEPTCKLNPGNAD